MMMVGGNKDDVDRHNKDDSGGNNDDVGKG